MRDHALAANIARSFRILLLCATFCMLCLVMGQVASLRLVGTGSQAHVLAFEPAKQLTASFDHEMLTASLSFNSFFATQAPDSLNAGWAHYRLAETRLHDLNALIQQHPQLNYLEPAVAQLGQELAAYSLALTSTMDIAQNGRTTDPQGSAQFKDHLKEWTARGEAVEKDAGDLENTTFRLSVANTNGIAQWISDGQTSGWLLLSISFFIYYLLMRILRRKLLYPQYGDDSQTLSMVEPIRSGSAAPNYGAR